MAAGTGARTTAWSVAVTIVLANSLLAIWVARHTDAIPAAVVDTLWIAIPAGVLVSIFPALAGVILTRHPRHAVALVILGVSSTILLDVIARCYALDGLYVRPGVLPGPEWAAWYAGWNWQPQVMTLLLFVPLLFPDGRLPSRRWRPWAIGAAVWIGLTTIGIALTLEESVDFPGVAPPVLVPAARPLSALMVLLPVALVVVAASLVVRWRRAEGDEREQLRWLLYTVGVAVGGWTTAILLGLLGIGDWGPVSAALTLGPILLVPVAITVAITRYRLYDIDVLINRTLVYGGLTVSVVVAYALIVLAVTGLTPATLEWRGSVLVVAVVAIAAYPLREWMQRLVNQRMYGDRDDPARAMSRLTRRLADQVGPEQLLLSVAETIGQALRLPYVAVELTGDRTVSTASYGQPRGEPERLDLVHQGEPVGTLVVARRSVTEQFTPADIRLLEDVSRQVAAAAHAVRLAEDLQRSRERLVLAREEERRRLRRDLHDGVGSALAGLALQAGHARRAIPESPDDALARLTALEDGIRASVIDIRRIVDDLRPPALDELGLAAALRERAEALIDGRVQFRLGTEDLALPAAVEVAAYRIGTEALTNAARHSGATTVTVAITVDQQPRRLVLEVLDNGSGLPQQIRVGVGLRSMRDRAVELGGRCVISSEGAGGTTVRATLPLPWPPGSGGGQ